MDFTEALSILKKETDNQCMNIEEIDVKQSLNLINYDDIFSQVNIPNFRTSMRDGYAIRYSDIDSSSNKLSTFIIKSNIYTDTIVESNESNETYSNICSYITTGSVIPDIYDTIVMIEDTIKIYNNTIQLKKEMIENIKYSEWIRQIGSDIKKDELVINKNTLINENIIGTLISIGIEKIKVIKQPSIALISSGSEIIDNKDMYSSNKNVVYDINRPVLKILFDKYGYKNINDYGILSDNYEETKKTIDDLIEKYDMVVTSGGISMGEQDYIKKIMLEKNSIIINKLKVKPGKPFLFSKMIIDNKTKYIFNLPGNPVSTIVNFHMLLKPSVDNIISNNFNLPTKLKCTLLNDLKSDKTRLEFTRGILYYSYKFNKFFVRALQENDKSSNISQLNNSNCFIETINNHKYNIGNTINVYQISQIKDYFEYENILNIGIVTTSDRASNNIYEDISGKEIIKYLKENLKSKFQIYYTLISDDSYKIKESINNYSKNLYCDLILTTGGTGPAFRDNTSNVTREIIDKELPGFGEIIRNKNFDLVCTSILSAQIAGIIYNENNSTLILNLPGKPNAIKECLDIIFKSLPKYFEIMESPKFVL